MNFQKIKIYEIEFITYTDATKTTVYCESLNQYIEVGNEPFLISEDQVEFYKQFGNGIRSLTFVGWTNIPVEDTNVSINTDEDKVEEDFTKAEETKE